jgi:hypothetical protein
MTARQSRARSSAIPLASPTATFAWILVRMSSFASHETQLSGQELKPQAARNFLPVSCGSPLSHRAHDIPE